MEWLDANITRAGLAYVSLALLVLMVAQAVLTRWALTQRNIYQEQHKDVVEELTQKRADRERFFLLMQAQVTKLQDNLADSQQNAYVKHFDTDQLYTLVAKAGIKTKKTRFYYGLVRYADTTLVPFMVPRADAEGLDVLQIGDQFSVFSNRLAGVIPLQNKSPNVAPVIPFPVPAKKPKAFDDETVEDYFESLPYLEVISGQDKGAVYYLPFTSCTIGNDKSNQILLCDESIQGVHARLSYEHNYFSIEGFAQQNMIHNNQKIKQKRLNFGDTITLGNTRLVFSCQGYEMREEDPDRAIDMFKKCLEREPNFIVGLKNLAFLLERDIRHKKASEPIWQRLGKLEKRS